MNTETRGMAVARLGAGSRGRLIEVAAITAAILGLAAPPASAQDDAARLDEIYRLFTAQGKAVAAIERLGGKVVFEPGVIGKKVVGVDFSATKVADKDFGPLKDVLKTLPDLSSIDLSRTAITDAGLIHLEGLPRLPSRRLRLAETGVTNDGVSRLFAALPNTQISRKPTSLKYFPPNAIESGPLVDFLDNWYSEDLYAMGEPSLWAMSKKDPEATAYRFLWTPSFRRPLALRLVATGEGATLDAVRLDKPCGYMGGRPVDRSRVVLTRGQWEEWKRKVDDARFSALPTKLRNSGLVADGHGYLMERAAAGTYHVVEASTDYRPNDEYRRLISLCVAMMKLSGLKDKDFRPED